MAWKKPTRITSWSISRLHKHDKCPLSLKFEAIDRIKAEQTPAMKNGDEVHKLAAAYIKGEVPVYMPASLDRFSELFKEARKRYRADPETVEIEESWAFRKDWSSTRFDDWDGCWLRAKIDHLWVAIDGTVSIDDWKTGKFSPGFNLEEYVEQLDLYATTALIKCADFGDDLRVIPRLRFLDHGITYPEAGKEKVYTPKDLPSLKKYWEARPLKMFNDTLFAPKPSNLCGWCFYRADNKEKGGGQCKY